MSSSASTADSQFDADKCHVGTGNIHKNVNISIHAISGCGAF